MNVVYHKIWADLWGHKLRTVQIVAIIALGVFSIGLVVGGRTLSAAAVDADWQRSDPPAMKISVNPPMSEDELAGLENVDGITTVEGFQSLTVEWRRSPDEPWKIAVLNARKNFDDQPMSRWDLAEGAWPTGNDIAMERGYGPLHGLALGDIIETRIEDRVRSVKITGILNSYETAPMLAPDLVLYMDHDRFGDVTGIDAYGVVQAQLDAFTPDGQFDQGRAEAIDAAVQERLDKLGIESQGLIPVLPDLKRVASPAVHFAQSLMDSAFMLIGVIGVVIIVLGGLLIYNTLSAVIAQQTNQIGIMKAIGARRGQVLGIYLTEILIYSLLACLIAIPLAGMAAHGMKLFFAAQLDLGATGFAISWPAVVLQVIAAILIPLLSSLIPLRKGANITVREAISTFGLGGAAGLLDGLLARMRRVSYTVLLMIGNTFRHRARVTITQIALIGGGVLFIAIMGVRDSTNYTFGPALTGVHHYQVNLTLQDDERSKRITQLVMEQPGVRAVEIWNTGTAFVRPMAQPEYAVTDASAALFGMPPDTEMYEPSLVEGRWLQLGDGKVIAMHHELADRVGVGVGDWVTLRFPNTKESDWQIVGLFFDSAGDRGIYMPQDLLAWEQKRVNRANTLFIKLDDRDPKASIAFAQTLTQFLEAKNIGVSTGNLFNATTIAEVVDRRLGGYSVIIGLLVIMAVLVGVVGGIGLSGTLSLSVLERTREIGVMRAIGASSRRITLLFMGEGLIQALLSWCIAVPLGILAGRFMATEVLTRTFGDALLYQFSPTGVLLWLGIVVVLTVVASWWPARNATRVSVRESLAYQ